MELFYIYNEKTCLRYIRKSYCHATFRNDKKPPLFKTERGAQGIINQIKSECTDPSWQEGYTPGDSLVIRPARVVFS